MRRYVGRRIREHPYRRRRQGRKVCAHLFAAPSLLKGYSGRRSARRKAIVFGKQWIGLDPRRHGPFDHAKNVYDVEVHAGGDPKRAHEDPLTRSAGMVTRPAHGLLHGQAEIRKGGAGTQLLHAPELVDNR